MSIAFWRRWHRWIGFPAAVFLLFASLTGVLVAFTEFSGEAEALREATRDLVSPVSTTSPDSVVTDAIGKALATARPTGGEDRRLIFDLRSGALVGNESYVDMPFLNRLHSGEWF